MDVAATLGALGIGLVALAVVPLADSRLALALVSLSAALAMGAAEAADAAVAATPFEVLAYGCAGAVFARVFEGRALAVGVPLLIGAIDIAALEGPVGDRGSAAPSSFPEGGDPLTLALPETGLTSPLVEVTVVVFLVASAVWARRLAPTPSRAWTAGAPLALAVVPAIGVAIASATDRALPLVALVGLVALAIQAAQLLTERRTTHLS